MDPTQLTDRVRQPEYTGENRCVPCTVVNVVIAAVVGGAVGLASVPLGVGAFLVFVGAIYLRGYLVPGTPTLTKRYFPDRVLRWFDKEPAPEYAVPVEDAEEDDIDVESALRSAGALEESDNPGDLYLQPGFRERWYDEMDHLDEAGAVTTLARTLRVPETSVTTEDRGKSYAVTVDGETAGKWESRASFVADMAAERVLSERTGNWTALPVDRRSGLLRALRVYLDRCPRCDGEAELSEETVESCCRSRQVFACRCRECNVRLFEINAAEVEGAGA